jgi:hypothetical protein
VGLGAAIEFEPEAEESISGLEATHAVGPDESAVGPPLPEPVAEGDVSARQPAAVGEAREEAVGFPEVVEALAPREPEYAVLAEPKLLQLHAEVPGDQLCPQIVEVVMMRLGPGMLMRAEPVQHASFVEPSESLPCPALAGEEKLVNLMRGQDSVFVEMEEELHVSVGDLTKDGIEVSPSLP